MIHLRNEQTPGKQEPAEPGQSPARPWGGRRALILVGFMGAGKTSVGQVLAERLGWRFLDLDNAVETREGRTIAEIFQHSGEAAFRRAETAALQQVLTELASLPRPAPLVLALGGGAFAQSENARAIKAAGVPVIFLDASLAELRERCAPQAGQRPLFQDENQFRQLYEDRRYAYMEADIRVETTGVAIEDVASEIMRRLELGAAGVEQNV